MVLTFWAARTRWYTYVSKPTAASPHIALVFQVPVGWQCVEAPRKNDDPFDLIDIQIRRKSLTGVARWWNQHVFERIFATHTDPSADRFRSTRDEIVRSIRVVQK